MKANSRTQTFLRESAPDARGARGRPAPNAAPRPRCAPSATTRRPPSAAPRRSRPRSAGPRCTAAAGSPGCTRAPRSRPSHPTERRRSRTFQPTRSAGPRVLKTRRGTGPGPLHPGPYRRAGRPGRGAGAQRTAIAPGSPATRRPTTGAGDEPGAVRVDRDEQPAGRRRVADQAPAPGRHVRGVRREAVRVLAVAAAAAGHGAVVAQQVLDAVDRRHVRRDDLGRDAALAREAVQVAEQAEARDVGHRVRARLDRGGRRGRVQRRHDLDRLGEDVVVRRAALARRDDRADPERLREHEDVARPAARVRDHRARVDDARHREAVLRLGVVDRVPADERRARLRARPRGRRAGSRAARRRRAARAGTRRRSSP